MVGHVEGEIVEGADGALNMADTIETSGALEPAAKKSKVQSDLEKNGENIHTILKDFSEFRQKRILSDNSQRKTVCIEGTFNNREGTAIVLLEKKPFNEESLKNTLDSNCVLHKEFSNDIYGFYECFPNVKYNGE
jgi:hypothetical protein